MKILTTDPVAPGDSASDRKEFGRQADVQRIYGLKRGTTYNLWRQGKIRGVLLRVKGQKSGVRLWDMDSIRQYILSQMDDTENQPRRVDEVDLFSRHAVQLAPEDADGQPRHARITEEFKQQSKP